MTKAKGRGFHRVVAPDGITQLVGYLLNESPTPTVLREWVVTWLDTWCPKPTIEELIAKSSLGAPPVEPTKAELDIAMAAISASQPAERDGQWVSPSKRTPDVGDRVLCITTCDDPMVLDYAGAGDFTDPEDDTVTIAVKLWMPVPPQPKET